MEGTRLVDRGVPKCTWGGRSSFRTASFVILRVTDARPLLHFDTGLGSAALGLVCDGTTCTTGPALPPQVAAGRDHGYEG